MGSTSTPFSLAAAAASASLYKSTPCISTRSAQLSVILQRSNLKHHTTSLLYLTRNDRGRVRVRVKIEDVTEKEEEEEACELVSRVELSIPIGEGEGDGVDTIEAYLCKAVKNNNGIGILLLSDIFGFQDSATRDFAYRVACNGYNVLVPDLFRGDPWTKERPFEEWHAKQHSERIVQDIFTSAKWMVSEFGISNKLGVVGFCFGGGHVIDILAQDNSNGSGNGNGIFGTGISFYGTRINTSHATNISVPLLLISGDSDPLCPVDDLKTLEKEIKDSKVIVFEGRGHGFVHRPQSLEEDEDAEAAFVIMRNWLHDAFEFVV